MRRLLMTVLTIGSIVALAAASAQPTPEMPDSVAQFWKRLATAKTITYTMKRWQYDILGLMSDAQPGSQIFYVSNSFEVRAQRPNRISISISPGIERDVISGGRRQRQFLNNPGTIYINNGKQSITYLTTMHTYSMGKGIDALANDKNDYAVNVQTYWIFDDKPMEGYQLVPESLAPSSDTVIYTLTDPKSPDSQQRIYFERKTGSLTQASDYVKDDKGIWNENRRQEFRFWDFDARLPAEIFTVRPLRTYITDDEYDKIHNIRSAKTAPK